MPIKRQAQNTKKICSICHDYGNFCQVKVTLLHKIFVAKYIFIFNRVLCCKNWKNETLIGITKMDFNKALFFVIFWANLVSFVSATISKMHYVCRNFHTQFINGCELKF